MRLQVLPTGDVEVVVPRGQDPAAALEFVESRRDWIERTRTRIGEQYHRRQEACSTFPDTLELRALGESWYLDCVEQALQRARLDVFPGRRLRFRGDLCSPADCHRLLRNWIRSKARLHLPDQLQRVAADIGLSYRKVTIRAQRRRWGSCSDRGDISLNCKLLFLPSELVDYLLVHELCHTRHLDHSSAFWGLVEKKLSGYRELDRRLRRAGELVPAWFSCE
jgi:predicted metal-dependent hydrolase